MQISIVILLFSDQISGRSKVFKGGGDKLPQGARPAPLWEKASNSGTEAKNRYYPGAL